MNKINIFPVGHITTCQMGNSSDTYDYEPAVSVTVLGHKVIEGRPGRPLYLVKVNGMDIVGRATLMKEGEGTSVLYCTAAIKYGRLGDLPGVKTQEQAIKLLF